MYYLSGHSGSAFLALARSGYPVGIMSTPKTTYRAQLNMVSVWAADNGRFKSGQGDAFDLAAYLDWLAGLAPLRRTCLFAAAPDTWNDWPHTLSLSRPVLPLIRSLGFPAAIVAQTDADAASVPWPAIDALFFGGPDTWQMSEAAAQLAQEGRKRGKWVHRGRVNSYRRLRAAELQGCHSADGTFLAKAPDTNAERMRRWFDKARAQPSLFAPLIGD